MPPRPAPVLPELDPLAARRLELAADGVLSVADAEAFVGLGTTEVYSLMGDGTLAYAKHGKRRLVSKRSCVEFLAARMALTPEADIDGHHHCPAAGDVHRGRGLPAAADQPGGVPPRVGGRVQPGGRRKRPAAAAG